MTILSLAFLLLSSGSFIHVYIAHKQVTNGIKVGADHGHLMEVYTRLTRVRIYLGIMIFIALVNLVASLTGTPL